MVRLAWLTTLNILPISKTTRGPHGVIVKREYIPDTRPKRTKTTEKNNKRKAPIGRETSDKPSKLCGIHKSTTMFLDTRGMLLLLFVSLVFLGCYALDGKDSSSSEIRDFKLLENVLKASKIEPCDEEKKDHGPERRARKKRHADSLEVPRCLADDDPIYYVSKYHRAVCHSTVDLAYEVFYEREPSVNEFEHWFERCVSRDIDEAYMMWKFAESEEHLDLLERKRKPNSEKDNGENENDDEDDAEEESTVEITIEVPVVVPMKIRLPEKEFSEELQDPESEEFQELADEYSHALADILCDVPGLAGVKVLGFGNGSLIVYYQLIFEDDEKTLLEVYTDDEETGETGTETKDFDDAKFAEKVTDKVKEALSHPEDGRFNNTILSDAHVDLESLETISQDVVDEFVKLNPSAPIVPVDLTTSHDHEDDESTGEELRAEDANSEEDSLQNTNLEEEAVADGDEEAETSETLPESTENENHEDEDEEEGKVTNEAPTETTEQTTPLPPEVVTEGMFLDEGSGDEPEESGMTDGDISGSMDADSAVEGHTDEQIGPDELVEPVEEPSNADLEAEYLDESDSLDIKAEASVSATAEVSAETHISVSTDVTPEETNVTNAGNDSVTQVTSPPDIKDMQSTIENSLDGAEEEENPFPAEEPISTLIQTVVMKLRVTNVNYTHNLTDRTSEEFQYLKAKFMQILQPIMQPMDGFLDMEIIGFSSGSLIVNNELHFRDHAPENVKEDVKERIHAAAGYFKYAHLTVDPESTEVLRPDEADLCEFVQCHLYSDCVVRTDYRTECICRPGYVYVDPASCVSLCDLEPGFCRNGGECHIVPGRGAVCRCRVSFNWGYQGERCEETLPRSVLLVSASTAVACVAFMLLVAGSAYFFYRRRRSIRAERKAKDMADKDFMRAAQIMSLDKSSTDSGRVDRVNPMFVTEDESPSTSSTDAKDLSTSSCPSPKTSMSSMDKSIGSMSTSSFFVRDQLDNNGPLPGDMNTPERRMLHLQVRSYPDHRGTWCGEKNERHTRAHKKMKERLQSGTNASVKSH